MPTLESAVLEKPRFTQLIFTSVDIESRSETIKATYWLLLASVTCAGIGGYIGSQSEELWQFFTSTFGIITGLLLLNFVPFIALRFIEQPRWGLLALGVDGFLSGIVISPLLHFAAYNAPELIWVALGLTIAVFASVTGYIMVTGKTYSAPQALMAGVFLSIIAAVLLGTQFNLGVFEVVIAAVLAVFGVVVLVSNTSRVLLNPLAVGAVPGALMLFAGIFNVFVGVLRILLFIMSAGRRR